jgi:hypothetical protein
MANDRENAPRMRNCATRMIMDVILTRGICFSSFFMAAMRLKVVEFDGTGDAIFGVGMVGGGREQRVSD